MNEQEMTGQGQETGGETPPAETGNAGGEQTQTELTPQEMIDSLIEARGGLPKIEPAEGEEISEREQSLIESNFQMETRFMLQGYATRRGYEDPGDLGSAVFYDCGGDDEG